jgi:hypothetical protein
VIKNGCYYSIVSISKNGLIKIYDKKRLIYEDVGYLVDLEDGRKLSNQLFDKAVESKIDGDINSMITISTTGNFSEFDDSLPLRRYIIPFKLVAKSLLKSDWIAQRFAKFIKLRRIIRIKRAPLILKRIINFRSNSIMIEDELSLSGNIKIKEINIEKYSTVLHSPGSRYFIPSKITSEDPYLDGKHLTDLLNSKKKVVIKREISLDKEGISISKEVGG